MEGVGRPLTTWLAETLRDADDEDQHYLKQVKSLEIYSR